MAKHNFRTGQTVIIKGIKNTAELYGTNRHMRKMVGQPHTILSASLFDRAISIGGYTWHYKDLTVTSPIKTPKPIGKKPKLFDVVMLDI